MPRAAIALTLVVLAAIAPLAGRAARASGPLVVHADVSAGPIRLGRTTAAAARTALVRFGAPRAARHGPSCTLVWRRLALSVDFAVIGTDPRNPCTAGTAVIATVRGRTAWRTARGLRVGDPVARIRRLYRRARLDPSAGYPHGYWLVPRRACETVGALPYPGLLARVAGGRVTALVARIAICD